MSELQGKLAEKEKELSERARQLEREEKRQKMLAERLEQQKRELELLQATAAGNVLQPRS